MLFGFERVENEWREKTPALFKNLPRSERRRLFLSQYNFCVDSAERIKIKVNIKQNTLFETFNKQILSRLKNQNRLSPHPKNILFDVYSAILIKLFTCKEYEKIKEIVDKNIITPKYSKAKLIHRIFAGERSGIVFDAKSLFGQFVFERIKIRNKNRKVSIKDDLIVIEDENRKCLLAVMLCFKEMTKDKIHLAKEEINQGWNYISKSDVPALYLVFPKNEFFKRHIEIKNPCFTNSSLKLVPYCI
ncbi:MAG: hypothetical protein ACK5LP_06125 [Campylobacteraceae bacterium]